MYKRQMKKFTCELKNKKSDSRLKIKERPRKKHRPKNEKKNIKKKSITFFCMWNHFYFISHFSSLHGICL